MNQEQKDFNDDEQEEENLPQENPPAGIKDLPQEPELRNGPIDVQMNNEVELDHQ